MKIGRRQALVGGALIAGGCGKTVVDPPSSALDAGPNGAAPLGPPPAPFGTLPPCTPEHAFAADIVVHEAPAARVFYSWTTPEQITELRQGKVLFTRTERPGLGPGYAMDLFASLAGSANTQQQIAAVLSGNTFAKARYAWTTAWATRMGWPGESYGNQLLRLELRKEAFIVSYSGSQFRAYDLDNKEVSLADVLAAPARIGAIYFVKDDIIGSCASPDAGPPFVPRYGSFTMCATGLGYREYILGNEAMIAEWSHATAATRAEIERGQNLLHSARYRVTAATADPGWNPRAVDAWRRSASTTDCDGLADYVRSLAIPSTFYEPVGGNLEAIATTLAGDLFTPDPFVVKPGA